MATLLAVWVALAVALNFGGADPRLFTSLTGNSAAIRSGEVWRLFTAPFVHLPSGQGSVEHILFALLGLYFLAPALEARWGGKRLVGFLLAAAEVGFLAQFLAESLLPRSLAAALGNDSWFGFYGALDALAIAWALSHRGAQVRLFFALPVSAEALVAFVVGINVLRIVGAAHPLEGVVTPFGGMLAGWALDTGLSVIFK